MIIDRNIYCIYSLFLINFGEVNRKRLIFVRAYANSDESIAEFIFSFYLHGGEYVSIGDNAREKRMIKYARILSNTMTVINIPQRERERREIIKSIKKFARFDFEH